MSAQILGEKKTRRLERLIRQPIARAWTHGVHGLFSVALPAESGGHRHALIRIYSSEDVELVYPALGDEVTHYSSCKELFPNDPEWSTS